LKHIKTRYIHFETTTLFQMFKYLITTDIKLSINGRFIVNDNINPSIRKHKIRRKMLDIEIIDSWNICKLDCGFLDI